MCEVKGDVEMAEEFYARATDFHEDNMGEGLCWG